GGGSSGGGDDGTGGIDGRGPAVVSQGSITGFGSIIVNGVEYETTSSEFEIDGETGTESELEIGDVVVIAGLWTALHYPLAFMVFLVFFILLLVWLLPKIWRGVMKILAMLANLFRPKQEIGQDQGLE
ncbi:MAG: hypothetical protein R3297_02595, partial [Desulfobulbales bacterium]|nr:hypothetical protein [Desulfobulbales bacterium]